MNTKIKQEIIDYSDSLPNQEVCGFIYYNRLGKSFVKKCDNIHNDKYNYFEISPLEFIVLSADNELFAIFHSHTGDECEFSKSDKDLATEYRIPIYLYNTKHKIWKEYLPEKLKFNLTGNPFSWGLFDCYTSLRLFYWNRYNYQFKDYDRDDEFDGIPSGEDSKTIEQRLLDLNFSKQNDLENGDIILTEYSKFNYCHISVYEDGYIYDHKIGRLSEKNISMLDLNKIKIYRNSVITNKGVKGNG